MTSLQAGDYLPDHSHWGYCPRCNVWTTLTMRVPALGTMCSKCDEIVTKAVLEAENQRKPRP